jgi:hypothetical protein
MAGAMARPLLAALALLSLVAPAASVEVCKVVDLQLVTQTGEFFLAGKSGTWRRTGCLAAGHAQGSFFCGERAERSVNCGVCFAGTSCWQGCRWL